VDFRETAPALANKTMYIEDPTKSKFGGLAVGIPGEVRGLEEAHKRWGTLHWERLVRPSVELAAGCKVGKELAKRINVRSSIVMPSVVVTFTYRIQWPKIFDDRVSRLE
jgi:gamma-glutamyltranspeptidase/glutathione hydrolase/leukotriene-C4 hydrolase